MFYGKYTNITVFLSILRNIRVFVCSDRPGVTQHREVDELQERFALTLKTYISAKRSGPEKQ